MRPRAGGRPALVGLDAAFESLRAQHRGLPPGRRADTLLVTCHASCEVRALDRLGFTLRLRTLGRRLDDRGLTQAPLRAVLELGIKRVVLFGNSGCPSLAPDLRGPDDTLERLREAAAQWYQRRLTTQDHARASYLALRASLVGAGRADVEISNVVYAADTGMLQIYDAELDQLACTG
ncbi:MAG: hypothetical protein JNL21_11915 [Myxococcales bacterium]|nr:hypothetical protein [Myxococcales bacterium]